MACSHSHTLVLFDKLIFVGKRAIFDNITPIFAQNFRAVMRCKRLFSLFVLVFSLFAGINSSFAQAPENAGEYHESATAEHAEGEKKEKINITELVFGHVGDSHEWHLFSLKGEGGHEKPVAMPLPMILYVSAGDHAGLHFMSSGHFEEWEAEEGGRKASNEHDGFYIEKNMKEKVFLFDDKGKPEAERTKVYDFSITKNVLSMMISVVLLLWLVTSAAKKYKSNTAPKGFQNALEVFVVFIRDEVAKPNLGAKYARHMPLLLTIFFFIWINNLLGLLPGGANFTGNIAVTACLALVAFIAMMASSNKYFWSHLLNPPDVPFLVKCLLVLIEVMSLMIKPVALMIRLFANMLAGHIVILSVICLIFIFALLNVYVGGGFVLVSLAFSVFMFMLELLVAVIQAFIFTNLTAVFIGQASEEHHHDHAHDEHAAAH